MIIGTTLVTQVRECVRAFKIELPQALMDAIDDVHEVRTLHALRRLPHGIDIHPILTHRATSAPSPRQEIRNPAIYVCRQHTHMVAKWLGAEGRKASDAANRKAIEASQAFAKAKGAATEQAAEDKEENSNKRQKA